MKYSKILYMKTKKYLLPIILSLLLFFMIKNPGLVMERARLGLYSWFNILLPSLLPFMIISEILISSDSISSLAPFLDPIMGFTFKIPGLGALPLLIGYLSGYPMGARLSCQLRKSNLLSRQDANRLIAFSNTSGPLFILGTVSIGLLNTSEINLLLLFPHFFGALTLGFFLRAFNRRLNSKGTLEKTRRLNKFEKLYELNKQKLPLGRLISNSVKNSINNILLIGGFVVLYSVLIEIVFQLKSINYIIYLLSDTFNVASDVIRAFLSGIIEITQGCISIASLNTSFFVKIIMLNFTIAWGGLSIHSQALSFILETDISPSIYLLSKIGHGFLSIFYTIIIYFLRFRDYSLPSFSFIPAYPTFFNFKVFISTFLKQGQLAAYFLFSYLIISSISNFLKK